MIFQRPLLAGDYLTFGLAAVCVFGTISILPATMSRSAWLAALIGGGLVVINLYACMPRVKNYIKLYTLRSSLIGIIFVFLIGVGCYATYHLKKDSADGRLLLWKISWQTFRQHPWTGVGKGHFAGAFGQTQAAYFASGEGTPEEEKIAGAPVYGFNEFLQIGVEHGLTGLLLFLIMTGGAIWTVACSKQTGTAGIAASLSACLVFACFSYPFSIPQLQKLFVALLFAAAYFSSDGFLTSDYRIWITRTLILIPLYPVLINQQNNPEWIKARRRWKEEQRYYEMKIYQGTVDNYRELYPLLKNNIEFLFEYGQCLSKTGQYEESNLILTEGIKRSADPMFHNIMGQNYQALKQYAKAEAAFFQALYRVPHRLLPRYFLTKLYWTSGDTLKARQMGEILLEKEPKIMSPAVKEMKEEITQLLNP